MKIGLVTDVHFGRIANDGIVEALVADVAKQAPDMVILGGDLTQRARKRELRAASKLISDLNAEIAIPGNHDVFAWWFPVRRLLTPLTRYCDYVSDSLDQQVVRDGVAVLALNSSYGWTVKGGRFVDYQFSLARQFFERNLAAETKVLVVHHHLKLIPDAFGNHDVARRGGELLKLAVACGVDVILCGHLHQSHAQTITDGTRSVVLVSSGTATSDRGRRADTNRNIYELVECRGNSLSVEERVFDPSSRRFDAGRTFHFERDPTGSWQLLDDRQRVTES